MRNLLAAALVLVAASGFAEELPSFDVHFVVVTAQPGASERTTEARLREEVEILNRYFLSASGERLLNFKFKSFTPVSHVKASSCGLLAELDADKPYSGAWLHLYKACADPKIRDLKAVNFLVYDSYAEPKKRKDVTSKGGIVGGRPYVLIDWERLGHKIQSPEEHEMGHAFGLKHVCPPAGAKNVTPTNIMATGCNGFSGGARTLGFDAEQVATVKKNAAKYLKLFQKGGTGADSAQ